MKIDTHPGPIAADGGDTVTAAPGSADLSA